MISPGWLFFTQNHIEENRAEWVDLLYPSVNVDGLCGGFPNFIDGWSVNEGALHQSQLYYRIVHEGEKAFGVNESSLVLVQR